MDAGSAWVGVARGSSLARLAEPLKTLPAAAALDELRALAQTYAAAGVVIGLPRGLDGSDTAQTKAVRQWARQAKNLIKLPFYWQDEALTSRAAAGELQTVRLKSQNVDEHGLAATVILQDFLDTPESERVRC